MADRTDICVVDDAAWERAVAREAVIRRLASSGSPGRAEFLSACRKLGIKRSRLYELIGVYKARPVTSSLLTAQAGSPAGSRRLPDEIELVISETIAGFFKSRQKPSIHALQKEVRSLAIYRGYVRPEDEPREETTVQDAEGADDMGQGDDVGITSWNPSATSAGGTVITSGGHWASKAIGRVFNRPSKGSWQTLRSGKAMSTICTWTHADL